MRSPGGIKIEVKSASYRQTWGQKRDSEIRFGIAPTQLWSAETGEYRGERKRHAEVYIFCLRDNRQTHERDPLELSRWRFYVLRTTTLDAKHNRQNSIGLRSLLALDPAHCAFEKLAVTIDAVFIQRTVPEVNPKP